SGDIEAADRLVVVAAAEVPVGALRVHAGHDGEEVVVADLTGQTELVGAVAEPHAAWLARLEVVVRELLDVVGAGIGSLQGGDPHGHGRALPGAFPIASVHSSIRSSGLGSGWRWWS